MSNLKSIDSVSPITQKGGRGYRHKKGCKCPLCKKGGADPISNDYDSKLDKMEMGSNQNFTNNDDDVLDKMEMGSNQSFATDDDYNELDDIESGNSTGKAPGDFKAGGSRRRKNKRKNKTKKVSKKRKSAKRGRKTRRHRKKH